MYNSRVNHTTPVRSADNLPEVSTYISVVNYVHVIIAQLTGLEGSDFVSHIHMP